MPGKQGAQSHKSGSDGDRDTVIQVLRNAAPDGLTLQELGGGTGLRPPNVRQAVDFLLSKKTIRLEGKKYYIN